MVHFSLMLMKIEKKILYWELNYHMLLSLVSTIVGPNWGLKILGHRFLIVEKNAELVWGLFYFQTSKSIVFVKLSIVKT